MAEKVALALGGRRVDDPEAGRVPEDQAASCVVEVVPSVLVAVVSVDFVLS